MKNDLNEAFEVSKAMKDGNPIAYLDPNKPENIDTYKHKDIFKKHGAKWDNLNRRWFWYIGKTEDQWRNVYDKLIKPALMAAHKAQDAPENESEQSLVASLDALISSVDATPTTGDEGGVGMSNNEKVKLKADLSQLKERLVNLDNDEEFKKTMQTIAAFKNAQGHPYSFNNTILIWIQNPNARFVMSSPRWLGYNKKVKADEKGKPIWVNSPSKKAITPYSKQQKEQVTKNFLNQVRKQSVEQLTVGEKDKLSVMLRGQFQGGRFEYTPAYDVSQVEQIEGKEDLMKDYDNYKNIKWSEEDVVSEEVRPIYNALLSFAETKGINVNLVDDLGGARGVSKNGAIDVLKNEGNDVGLTKTLAHEITHEILHQNYLQSNDPEMKQYFIGRQEGRDLVEQQAELSAWMILASYGFDLSTTSFNYAAIWGADKNKMIKVFDMVTSVVNFMLNYINQHLSDNISEGAGGQIKPASMVSPLEVAKVLGVESEYNQELKKGQMVERYNKLVSKK